MKGARLLKHIQKFTFPQVCTQKNWEVNEPHNAYIFLIHVLDEDEYQSSISIETSSFNEVPPCSDELPSRSKAKPVRYKAINITRVSSLSLVVKNLKKHDILEVLPKYLVYTYM